MPGNDEGPLTRVGFTVDTPHPTPEHTQSTVTISQIPALASEAAARSGLDSSWSHPTTSSGAPLTFGEFEVIGELGEGGMGRVYKAIDRNLGRHVAVKLLRSTDPFEASRFRGEAEMIALLDHPNIVQIYAIDICADGRPYIALEYAEGGSLDRELKGQPLEPRRAAEMAETLARAVHFAHEKGVIHRDLKPANILRGKGGILKLTDFGLAKQLEVSSGMTPSGAVMGTPSYMAPEQAEGKVKQLGPPTDVYGLGAILYEMLTGRPPFRGVNLVDTLEQVRWAEPASPSQFVPRLHRDLATICLKCLRKTPGQRYATAGELADDLRHWLHGETIVARSAPSWERAWRQVRRRPWQAATVGLTLLALAIAGAGAFYYYDRQRAAEVQAQKEDYQRELDEREKTSLRELAHLRSINEKLLRSRSDEALVALGGIRDRILMGKLHDPKQLDQLKDELFNYYRTLNDQLKQEEGYDKNKLAKSWLEIGKLIHETGRKDKALEAYVAASELFQAVAKDTPESRFNRADAEIKRGRLAFELNKDAEALKACDSVDSLLTGLAVSNPKCAGDLAEAWHLRGELYDRSRGERSLGLAAAAYQKAIEYRLIALAGADRLPADKVAAIQKESPEQFRLAIENLRGLARGYGYLGDVWLNGGELVRADKEYWNAHRMRAKVVEILKAVDLSVEENRRELFKAESQFSRGWGNCARVQTYCRALGTAKYFAQESLELRKKVSAANPSSIEFNRDVCSSANQVAELKIILGEFDGVAELIDIAGNVPRDLSEAEGGYSSEGLGIVAKSHLLRAEYFAYKPTPDIEQSKSERKLATTLLEQVLKKNPTDSSAAFNLAVASAMRADNLSLTGPGMDAVKTNFHNQAIEALERAIQNGYREKHPDDIREMRPFSKLKGNPKFEELIGRLRAAREPAGQPAIKTSASSP
ncbi:MAG: hypothetical protein C0467_00245 [Planctomycetaceae bacterium]|nr:hypothetical protein [Planctomycetaceae bacterium]